MVEVGLCTLLMTLDKLPIFQKTKDVCRASFYVNVEKLLCFIDYWTVCKLLKLLRGSIIFIFNLKAGNALATSSTFLPEVFEPGTDKLLSF